MTSSLVIEGTIEPVKTVAILSQKGGSGKSTIAVHLAVAGEKHGKTVLVIDLDPQASATNWKDLREGESPVVASAQPSRLAQLLKTAEDHKVSLVIIDTPPNAEKAVLDAARVADLILIPCRPSVLDLRAIGATVDLVRMAKKSNAFVVLNAVPPRGTLAEQASSAVSGYELQVCPVQLGHRADFVHALTDGRTAEEYEPNGKASQEAEALYEWAMRQLK